MKEKESKKEASTSKSRRHKNGKGITRTDCNAAEPQSHDSFVDGRETTKQEKREKKQKEATTVRSFALFCSDIARKTGKSVPKSAVVTF